MLIRDTNNRATATIKLENTSKQLRKKSLKFRDWTVQNLKDHVTKKTKKYIKIIIIGGKRHDTNQ